VEKNSKNSHVLLMMSCYDLYIKRLGAPLTPAFDLLKAIPVVKVFSYPHRPIVLFFLLGGIFLGGCHPPRSLSPVQPSIPTAAVQIGTTAAAAESPQATSPSIQSITPQNPTEPTPPGGQGTSMVRIFLVAIEDNGRSGKKIGCTDSVVPVEVTLLQPTQAVLRASLEALLAVKTQVYGGSGLYNALYQSSLAVEKLSLDNGLAVIHLRGEMKSGGVCDDPRLIAQLEETALQFSNVQQVEIFVNDVPIKQLLSGK
jgi:hypothetical protein